MYYKATLFLLFLSATFRTSAQNTSKFKGQGPIQGVNTSTKPVQKQWKGTFTEPDSHVYFSNNFAGGRLNGLARINDTTYTALITSENTPINNSAWYAFKVWANSYKQIIIKLTYQQGAKHRYSPKISNDGIHWRLNDTVNNKTEFVVDSLPDEYQFKLKIGPDTTWVAAQELFTSKEADTWIAHLQKDPSITQSTFGNSTLGQPLKVLKIGNPKSKNRILIIGRQHPPEVTGQYALSAFVEQLASSSPLAKKFKDKFLIYVVPLMNPDGVNEGFWRNNAGGIDLNRDWSAFHQAESTALRDYLNNEITAQNNKLYFAIDFHSTVDDIYYTVDLALKGNLPGLIPEWLDAVKNRIPGYIPNIKPLFSKPPTYTAFSYFFTTYGAESLVYEIGDKTPRDFIKHKGEVSADILMELLLKKVK
jgi:hypothetical protein